VRIGDVRDGFAIAGRSARLPRAWIFARLSQYLVNPEHLVGVSPFFVGSYVLWLDDKARTEVPVSRLLRCRKKVFGLYSSFDARFKLFAKVIRPILGYSDRPCNMRIR